jgi:hypothetical protein
MNIEEDFQEILQGDEYKAGDLYKSYSGDWHPIPKVLVGSIKSDCALMVRRRPASMIIGEVAK